MGISKIIVRGSGGFSDADPYPHGEKPDDPEPKPGDPGLYVARPTDAAALKAVIARDLSEELERVFEMGDLEFPKDWNHKHAQRVMDSAVEQIVDRVSSQQARLFSTAQETTEELKGEIEQNKGLRVPPGEEAVKIRVAPAFDNDIWSEETISSKDYKGPRRIWSVNLVNKPEGMREGEKGPYRYRLQLDDVQFTPLSMRFLDSFSNHNLQSSSQQGSRWEVSYGIVIKDMPWFGSSPPRDFFSRTVFQNPPAQLQGNIPSSSPNWINGNHAFAESKANDTFVTNAPLLYSAFNDFDLATGPTSASYPAGRSWIAPDHFRSYSQSIGGLSFMMVNATTADAVYSQVNGRESANMASIGGNATGPSFSLPDGFEVLPPCVASLMARQGTDGTVVQAVPISDLSGEVQRRVHEGAPIRYVDCEALALRPNAFAMVIQVVPPLILDWTDHGLSRLFQTTETTDDLYAAAWHTAGIKIDPQGDRETFIDIVVE